MVFMYLVFTRMPGDIAGDSGFCYCFPCKTGHVGGALLLPPPPLLLLLLLFVLFCFCVFAFAFALRFQIMLLLFSFFFNFGRLLLWISHVFMWRLMPSQQRLSYQGQTKFNKHK